MRKCMYVGILSSLERGGWVGFVKDLHLIGFYKVFNLQTRAISWFVYLVVDW